jgi:hypothetical protein
LDTALPYEARRSGPRAMVPFPVTVRPVGSYVTEPARIRDLSAKGISVYAELEIPLNTEVEVVLWVPYEISLTRFLPVRFRGEVLRTEAMDPVVLRRIAATLVPHGNA